MYLDTEFFTQGFFILNTQGQCEHYSIVSTNLKFLKSYLFAFNDNGKSFTQAIRETPPDSYSYFLWRNHEECPLIQLKRTCDSLKGLVIYKRFGNTIEFWEFSGKNSAAIPNSISRSSLMPFLNFITYFNEHKASNQLVSPSAAFPSPIDMSYIQQGQVLIENFKNSITSNNFTLWDKNQSIHLSKREWECLSEVAHGKTCKEIAYDLSISSRTVETYLNKIKEKAGVRYKSELVKLFYKNSLVEPFYDPINQMFYEKHT